MAVNFFIFLAKGSAEQNGSRMGISGWMTLVVAGQIHQVLARKVVQLGCRAAERCWGSRLGHPSLAIQVDSPLVHPSTICMSNNLDCTFVRRYLGLISLVDAKPLCSSSPPLRSYETATGLARYILHQGSGAKTPISVIDVSASHPTNSTTSKLSISLHPTSLGWQKWERDEGWALAECEWPGLISGWFGNLYKGRKGDFLQRTTVGNLAKIGKAAGVCGAAMQCSQQARQRRVGEGLWKWWVTRTENLDTDENGSLDASVASAD